jgi:hypothetical protein
MSLKMPALCLHTNLEKLGHSAIGARTISTGISATAFTRDLQVAQVVVTLSASHVLKNSPQFIVQGVEFWTPKGSILSADKCGNMPPQPHLICLGLVGSS